MPYLKHKKIKKSYKYTSFIITNRTRRLHFQFQTVESQQIYPFEPNLIFLFQSNPIDSSNLPKVSPPSFSFAQFTRDPTCNLFLSCTITTRE